MSSGPSFFFGAEARWIDSVIWKRVMPRRFLASSQPCVAVRSSKDRTRLEELLEETQRQA